MQLKCTKIKKLPTIRSQIKLLRLSSVRVSDDDDDDDEDQFKIPKTLNSRAQSGRNVEDKEVGKQVIDPEEYGLGKGWESGI